MRCTSAAPRRATPHEEVLTELKGSVAIVTGGGTGIGRATALAFAGRGAAAVVVNYSESAAEAQDTVAKLEAIGTAAAAMRADVGDDDAARRLISEAVKRFGRLDVLVNNAGTTYHVPAPDLEALTERIWRDILRTNLMGTFYCSRAAGPHLKMSGGAIVNVASTAAFRASGSSIPYAVSKAAVVQLTRSLAVALAPEVRVNAVAPGAVSTRWLRQVDAGRADDFERATAAVTPLRSVATPEQCAQAVVGLIESDFVTGEVITVDGGKHLLY